MHARFCNRVVAGIAGAVLMTASSAAAADRPFVIAHRGASGYVPEHTLAGYFIAIQQGADYVEPDLVITKDGALVVRHENEIGGTTDVASHPEFAARKTTKTIDGESMTGWFTEDFTLAELRTLRARERLPELRVANSRYDGAFGIPTLEDVLELVAAAEAQRAAAAREAGRPAPPRIGVYPETKHPSYFAGLGLHFDDRLLEALSRYGYSRRSDPICIQSFEVGNLKALRRRTDLPLVQLVGPDGQPFDFTAVRRQTQLPGPHERGRAGRDRHLRRRHRPAQVDGGAIRARRALGYGPGPPGAQLQTRHARMDSKSRERIPAG